MDSQSAGDSLVPGGSGAGGSAPGTERGQVLVPLMQRSFDGVSPRDPGTPRRALLAWAAAIVLIALITIVQQLGVSAAASGGGPAADGKVVPLGSDFDQADLAGRLAVKISSVMPKQNRWQFAQLVAPLEQPLDLAVRMVPAAVELTGVDQGKQVIAALHQRLERDTEFSKAKRHEMAQDLLALERLYASGSAAVESDDRQRIVERLGWQGKLALNFDVADSVPDRAALLANGGWIVGFMVVVIAVFVLAFTAGLVLLLFGAYQLLTGKVAPRLDRAAPGGSVGVEVLVVFLASFLGLQVLMELVSAVAEKGWLGSWMAEQAQSGLMPVRLLLQWVVLPLVIFYPRLAGFARGPVRRALGWHTGRGLGKEVLAGVCGYLACLPLYLGAVVLALLLSVVETLIRTQLSGEAPSGPVNPIGEILTSHGPVVVVLLVVLATVWAPIVEETVFRGAMLRQLHSRMAFLAAALISGTVFAMMHGYSPSLFPPLIALGAGFAVLRWWRGSLVPCVVAHALHNGSVTVISVTLFSLLG